jgi:hypothetical protein
MDKLQAEARNALLQNIKTVGGTTKHPGLLLKLAEAYAWVTSPDQPHGGSGTVEVSS